MTIGENIKALRKKNDLTQEKLAEYLCVSYQAVSKWECGLSSPDLSLIGPLTRLFSVSADELLGLQREVSIDRKAEIQKEYDTTFRTGDIVKRQAIAHEAIAEFPGEMKYLCWLAWCEAMLSFEIKDDDAYAAEQEKAIKHFAAVIENTDDEQVKNSAVLGIVQYLGFRGRYDEAKRYAELYPKGPDVTYDRVLLSCLKGQERIVHRQKMLNSMLTDLLNHIGFNSIEECVAQEQILKVLIPDENYLFYHGVLADNYRIRAKYLTDKDALETAVKMLKTSLAHAKAYDKFLSESVVYRFTSPFFDQVEYNIETLCRSGSSTMVDEFYELIMREQFVKLHDREDFKALWVS